ncbi:MAG: TonB-dependent receptor plug domain-containing protein [Rhodospirillaceae bacterium]
MKSRRFVLPLLCSAFSATAAQPDLELPTAHLAPIIVTGSRLPSTADSRSLIGNVLDAPAIAERSAASLPDLLRALGSGYIDQAGAPGGFSSLYLRGADPSHTAVILDGVKINDPTNARGGGFDLSGLDPYELQRVELIPGAASSIYGSDAMAGVLNLVTGPRDRVGANVGAGVGGRGYRRAYASLSGREGNLFGSLSGSALDDGIGTSAGYRKLRTASAKVNGSTGNALWSAALRIQERNSAAFPEDSGGLLHAVRRTLELRDARASVWSIEGKLPARNGSIRLYTSGYMNDERTLSPGVAPGLRDPFGLPRADSSTDYSHSTAGAVWSIASDRLPLDVAAGAEYARERASSDSTLFFGPAALPGDFSLKRETRSVFAEGRYRSGERFIGELGVRTDNIDMFGSRTTVRIRGAYGLGSESRLEIMVGTGFKPPSFFALGNPIVGNRNLQPETSRTVEVAYATHRSFGQRLSLFRSEYTNLVDFDAGPPPRLVNRNKVDISGVEYSSSVRAGRWRAQASATGLAYTVPSGATPLRNRPKWRAAASGTYSFNEAVSGVVNVSWRGKIFDSSIPTGGLYLQPDYLIDAGLSYARRDLRVSLTMDNVFNRTYEQFIGFPMPGRRLRLNVAFPLTNG